MAKKLKIASISAEVAPFSKSGGLADVSRSLPKALKRLKHEVIVITPYYEKYFEGKGFEKQLIYKDVELTIDKEAKLKINIWKGFLMEDLPVYFIENHQYFSKKKELYGSQHENRRFYLFDIAVLKLLTLLKFKADIIHCHDWHTGLIPELLKKKFKNSSTLKNSKTLFTIHNLVFQLGHNWWEILPEHKDYGHRALPLFYDPDIENINFAKRAIIHADAINAVSEQYAEEILTKKFGQDLHRILENNKSKLYGIVNGIDHFEYNPATDPGLTKNYNRDNYQARVYNKEALQKLFKLPAKKDIPLIGMASRISEQKGYELLFKILKTLLKRNVQFVIMGDGNKDYIKTIRHLQKQYPLKISHRQFEQKYETSIYAGADILLLPSRFEPCGLNQLIAMRYGCVPIVHCIGGLADTVEDFNIKTLNGNGFSFKTFHEYELLIALTRALEIYQNKDIWKKIIKNCMLVSSSWEIPAKKYAKLFKKIIKN